MFLFLSLLVVAVFTLGLIIILPSVSLNSEKSQLLKRDELQLLPIALTVQNKVINVHNKVTNEKNTRVEIAGITVKENDNEDNDVNDERKGEKNINIENNIKHKINVRNEKNESSESEQKGDSHEDEKNEKNERHYQNDKNEGKESNSTGARLHQLGVLELNTHVHCFVTAFMNLQRYRVHYYGLIMT